MTDPTPKINITPKDQSEFRPEAKKQELIDLHLVIVESKGSDYKEVHMTHREEEIGNLEFRQYSEDKFIKVIQTVIDHRYTRNELGLKLYESLISFAKENSLTKIKSDRIVQGGAIATWIKLSDKYKVLVNPQIEEKYNELVQIYKSSKFFKESLSVAPGDSVFELTVE
jgi:hypothetical protein